jgi:hypothetical protein
MPRSVTVGLSFNFNFHDEDYDLSFGAMSDAEFRAFAIEEFWSTLAENVNEDLPLVVEVSV